MPDDANDRPVAPETLAAQGAGAYDGADDAIIPPIQPSTTYLRGADGAYVRGRGYTRPLNPTYEEPQAVLARLEGGCDCRLFASGMAAATAVFQALVPGDHVVAPRIMYWALRKWLAEYAAAWGLDVTFVETGSLPAIERAVRPGRTRVVWLETPANPTWDVTDIEGASRIAHAAGARLVVDSTVATPVHTRPIEHGADLVMHSATKYLNGHSDVLAGALVTARDDAFWQRVRGWQGDGGAVLGPFEAWLLMRGMRTLFLRVHRASSTALFLARRLHDHPALVEVLYPGLQSHPGHAVASRQMEDGFGGMLSIRVRGGEAAAMATAAQLRLFRRATSLGGVESLVEHRASIEGPTSPVPRDLLRLSVGIEAPDDLLADLESALDRAGAGGVADPGLPDAAADGGAALEDRVRAWLETELRPQVRDRAGDVTLAGIDAGRVRLRAEGSPGALAPLLGWARRSLAHAVPEAGEPVLEPDGDPIDGAAGAPTLEAVQAALDRHVNPAVAAHGGRIRALGVDDGVVSIGLEGRCQGCGLSEVTIHQGVAPILEARLAGFAGVIDRTDHAAGTDPYHRPSKK